MVFAAELMVFAARIMSLAAEFMDFSPELVSCVRMLIDSVAFAIVFSGMLIAFFRKLTGFVAELGGFILLLIEFPTVVISFTALLTDFMALSVFWRPQFVEKARNLAVNCLTSGRIPLDSTGEQRFPVFGTGFARASAMARYKISLRFSRLPDSELDSFAGNTITQMTGNAGYPNPRVPLAALAEAKDMFHAKLLAALDGGRLATTAKNASRRSLIDLLRMQAAYVQSIAGADICLLLSSGFLAASTNRTPMLLPQTLIKSINSPRSTVLKVTVKPVQSARGYEGRYKTADGDFVNVPFSTSTRILLENLIPGVVYTIQTRAVGGSMKYGDWSDPISHMAV